MPVIIELVEDNQAPAYAFTLKRNGTVIDLTTAVNVVMNIVNAKNGAVTGTGVVLVVTSAAAGVVQFTPLVAHFPTGGRYRGEVKITHSGGLPETLNTTVEFVVRNKLL